MLQLRLFLLALAALALAACSSSSSDPGPLAGKWQSSINTTIEFRQGESVADGSSHKVVYQVKGNDVTVTHSADPTKGNSITYTIIDADNARSPAITLKRIK